MLVCVLYTHVGIFRDNLEELKNISFILSKISYMDEYLGCCVLLLLLLYCLLIGTCICLITW
jgi:hypothetical protein